MNFKKETIKAIIDSGRKEEDVMFIGTDDGLHRTTMEDFKAWSNFEYDCGFGAEKIPPNLIIYFKDEAYIKRGEYDGSEWWEYNEPLKFKKENSFKIFKLKKTDAFGEYEVTGR